MFKMSEEQAKNPIPQDAEMVLISDVHLDKPKVLEKLRTMMAEFALDPPVALIFVGNFTSQQGSLEECVTRLKVGMEKLTDMLLSFPSLIEKSEIVIIPGPSDPGNLTVNILPKPPLSKTFVDYLQTKIPKVHLANNPCRIRYYGHDIVIFRDDLVHKMRRHCIIQPQFDEETTEISHHLVKTLLDQSHLCPLPLHIQPVYWNFDHHLSLFPAPDVVF
jgi:DNA polymerase epsilon subunit 2